MTLNRVRISETLHFTTIIASVWVPNILWNIQLVHASTALLRRAAEGTSEEAEQYHITLPADWRDVTSEIRSETITCEDYNYTHEHRGRIFSVYTDHSNTLGEYTTRASK